MIRPRHLSLWTFVLLAGLTAGEHAHALTMYKANVVAWHANLMVSQGNKMVPAMSVNQGASLQVSDVTKNGWRQVLIRQGTSTKWGWVAENEIAVKGEVQVKNLPSHRGFEGSASDLVQGSFIFSAKGGYMMPFGSAGGPIFGADVGFQLTNAGRMGKLYLSAQALWTKASAAPLGFPGELATYPSLQVGLIARSASGSGFYGGALVGVSLIGITVNTTSGSASASTLQYSMTALAGYDIRINKMFSVGPEVSISDVAFGGYDTLQLLGAARLHF